MTPPTLAALAALAAALEASPRDRAELQAYGRLPIHLLDAIADHRPPAGGCGES